MSRGGGKYEIKWEKNNHRTKVRKWEHRYHRNHFKKEGIDVGFMCFVEKSNKEQNLFVRFVKKEMVGVL
jgi:hypothetical protein